MFGMPSSRPRVWCCGVGCASWQWGVNTQITSYGSAYLCGFCGPVVVDWNLFTPSLSLPLPPPSPCRMEELRAALVAHEDVDVLQKLCEGKKVPAELRIDLWKVSLSLCHLLHCCVCAHVLTSLAGGQECLGVSRRPDTMGNWSGPLDCEGQELIHTQCQEMAGEPSLGTASSQGREINSTLSYSLLAKLPLDETSRQQAAHEMELVITYYCKSRNLRYSPDCGWPELLLVLSSLHMSRADLFNCFYSLAAKYIPRYQHRHS